MFTGLIEDVGTIEAVRPFGGGKRLTIRSALPLSEEAVGASIAVNGVCLTAEVLHPHSFEAVAGAETMARTTLGSLAAGARVHLERALAVGDRLGGHLVQGHVDGVGRVRSLVEDSESVVIWVELPRELERYVAVKGSLTVDGVSLTVNAIEGLAVRINVVPHTAGSTCLGGLKAGARVNVEVDVVAKYVERMLGLQDGSQGLTEETLLRYGYRPGGRT